MSLIDARLLEAPKDGKLWYQRALLEFEHEDWAQTRNDLEKAERFAPGQFPTAWIQGQILAIEGKFEEAKSILDGFLATSPNHWGALASRARVEMKLELIEPALDDYRTALAKNPDAEPDLVQEVAQALAANERHDESIQVLDAGLKRLGPIPSLQLKILEVEANAGRYDSALARLGEMQHGAPRPEPWMEKRAALLAQAGRIPESAAAWRTLIGHLKNLPQNERDSHAMTLLSERAHQALLILSNSRMP